MLPLVAAALPALINAAPALIRLFGDSPQAETNAKAAEVVADLARQVTGEQGIEQAVDKIAAAPETAQAFRQSIEDNWYKLTQEVGGGIVAARQADRAASDSGKPWMSPALWVTLALLPLVYMVVAEVIYNPSWPNEIKAMVVAAIISGVLGSIVGFFLGTSYGSQRKTDMLAASTTAK